jgi:hypothetical protein
MMARKYRTCLVIRLLTAVVAAFCFSLAHADEPYVSIDAEDGVFYAKANPLAYWPGEYAEGNCVFPVYESGDWHVRPWICDDSIVVASNGSTNVIGFYAVAAADDNNVADRHELCFVSYTNSYALQLNQMRYISFDFYIDPAAQTPLLWTLICQAWQATYTMPPAFAIYARTNYNASSTNVDLDFTVRGTISGTTNYWTTNIWSATVSKGTWHHLIVQLKPSPPSDVVTGQVAICLDTLTPNCIWTKDWGYAASTNPYIDAKFDLRVGVYRRKQMRSFSWYVDNIKYGPTGNSVGMP